MAELEPAVLAAVHAGTLADSGDFAAAHNVGHQVVVGVLKSLISADVVVTEVGPRQGRCTAPRGPSYAPMPIASDARHPPCFCRRHRRPSHRLRL